MRLQPFFVFKSEVVRINELYWSSALAYDNYGAMLKLLADSGGHSGDVTVDKLWGATEYGRHRASTVSLDTYLQTLKNNCESLRVVAILHICSAFENALCGYFSLCALYDGKKLDSSYSGADIPGLLNNVAAFDARRVSVNDNFVNPVPPKQSFLKGKYSKRIDRIATTWGFPKITGSDVVRLNTYYDIRHKIAHDQGLGSPDAPEKSHAEILRNAISITESDWKKMIDDFLVVLQKLDDLVVGNVVKDGGLSLAIYRIVRVAGSIRTSDLKVALKSDWRISGVRTTRIKRIATALGFKIKITGHNFQHTLISV